MSAAVLPGNAPSRQRPSGCCARARKSSPRSTIASAATRVFSRMANSLAGCSRPRASREARDRRAKGMAISRTRPSIGRATAATRSSGWGTIMATGASPRSRAGRPPATAPASARLESSSTSPASSPSPTLAVAAMAGPRAEVASRSPSRDTVRGDGGVVAGPALGEAPSAVPAAAGTAIVATVAPGPSVEPMPPVGDERASGAGDAAIPGRAVPAAAAPPERASLMPTPDGPAAGGRVTASVAAVALGTAAGAPVAAESAPSSTAASRGIFGLRSGAQPPRSARDVMSVRLVVGDCGRGAVVAAAWGAVLAGAATVATVVGEAAAPSASARRAAGLGACGCGRSDAVAAPGMRGGSDGATGKVGDGIATSRGRRRETPADSCSADRGCEAAGASEGALVSFPGAAATRSAVEAAGSGAVASRCRSGAVTSSAGGAAAGSRGAAGRLSAGGVMAIGRGCSGCGTAGDRGL